TARQFAVADRLCIRDLAQRIPDLALEWRAVRPEWQIKIRACAGEVFVQLRARTGKRRVVKQIVLGLFPLAALALHPAAGYKPSIAGQQQLADRTVEQAENRFHINLQRTSRSTSESRRKRARAAISARVPPPYAGDRARAPSAIRGRPAETHRCR